MWVGQRKSPPPALLLLLSSHFTLFLFTPLFHFIPLSLSPSLYSSGPQFKLPPLTLCLCGWPQRFIILSRRLSGAASAATFGPTRAVPPGNDGDLLSTVKLIGSEIDRAGGEEGMIEEDDRRLQRCACIFILILTRRRQQTRCLMQEHSGSRETGPSGLYFL